MEFQAVTDLLRPPCPYNWTEHDHIAHGTTRRMGPFLRYDTPQRRRASARHHDLITIQQRERDLVAMGYVELGGEG
jgi:hypothetical protein